MFYALYEFGKLLEKLEDWQAVNEGMPQEYNRGLAIVFDDAGRFSHVGSINSCKDMIYRKGPDNGTDYTVCCKLAGATSKRILEAAKNLRDSEEIQADTQKRQWLSTCVEDYQARTKEIWQQVEKKKSLAGVDGKEHRGYVFWAKAIDELDWEPLYQWDCSKKALVRQVTAKWGNIKGVGACYVCNAQEVPVYGNFSVLKCYNLDKPGTIAGGFEEKLAHRNFPVCKDCAVRLAQAIARADSMLTSQLAGQAYMILPLAQTRQAREDLERTLYTRPDRFSLSRQHDILSEETALVQDHANQNEALAFYLCFFRENKASWQLQGEVQNVLPGRIAQLYQAGKTISRQPELCSTKEGETIPCRINARAIRNIAEASGDSRGQKNFLEWLCALFGSQKINYRVFVNHIVSYLIRMGRKNIKTDKKPSFMDWALKQAWGVYQYAALVGLIEPEKKEAEMDKTVPDSAYGKYVTEHPEFFNRPEKVVAFLTGCYARVVTNVQYNERKSSPFSKKFVGRILSRDLLKRLYREGHDKLAQYDRLGSVISTLDPDLANAWVACGQTWKISDEEATFAFTIGYSLSIRIGKEASLVEEQQTQTTGEEQ